MTVTRLESQVIIEEQAAEWVARLFDRRLTESEEVEFVAWLEQGERYRQAFDQFCEVYTKSEQLGALKDVLPLVEQDSSTLTEGNTHQHQARGSRFSVSAPLALAASLFIAVCLSFYPYLWEDSAPNPALAEIHSTQVGQSKTLTLSDGSVVALNTDTEIAVRFGSQQRSIELLQGEAHFDVAHSRERPFIVTVGGATVRAVGTAFNVDFSKDLVDVTVTEGTVEVNTELFKDISYQESRELLEEEAAAVVTQVLVSAGSSVTFGQLIESVQPIKSSQLEKKLSWQEGVLVFNGDTLEQVVEMLSRYTTVKIVFTDESVKDIPIGGYFPIGEIDTMLAALESGFKINVNRVSDDLVLLSSSL